MPGKSAQASTETEDAKGVRRDCFDLVEDYWRNAEISGAPCKELLVVMPAYNEEECVAQVIDAWAPELRKVAGESFRLLLLNDGSKDRTGETLQGLRSRHPELLVVNKPNSGHGQTCIDGYRFGVAKGYSWILQIDSDGQCDPCFFPAFWNSRAAHRVLFGFRVQRDDGFSRRVISRLVSVFCFLATGVWVRDANVPYRLMRSECLREAVPLVPRDFSLANILISLLLKKRFGIHWIDIRFRARLGGQPSVKPFSFAKHGVRLFKQLRALSEI